MIAEPSKIVAASVVVFLLGGCASATPEYQYRCEDGQQFSARFEQEKAQITVDGGREIELTQVRSASGVRYISDDQMLALHTKGDEAILVVNELSQATCHMTK